MNRGMAVGMVMVMVAGLPLRGWATDQERAEPESVQEPAPMMIKYTPPRMGMPGVRIGGGSRGESGDSLSLVAIVPDHVALSAKPNPSLCWHQAKATTIKRAIVVDDGQSVKPILEQEIGEPNRAGIQCVNLQRFGVALKPEVEYRWFIDAIIDSAHRSKDVVSGGAVMFKQPAPDLAAKLKGATGPALPPLLAANGYWYDAFEGVLAGLQEQPASAQYQEMKGLLLLQVGLPRY